MEGDDVEVEATREATESKGKEEENEEEENEEEAESWYSSGFFPPPKLLRSGEERDVSWSELFFDLVFVVVFARGGDQLRDQLPQQRQAHPWRAPDIRRSVPLLLRFLFLVYF